MQETPDAVAPAPSRVGRLAAYRLTYVAIFGFLLLYVFSVKVLEASLQRHFERALAAAVRVDPATPEAVADVPARVERLLRGSRWIHPGGVRVDPVVLGADGRTLLYAGGGIATPFRPTDDPADLRSLLPARTDLVVTVPHNALVANALLLAYAGALLAVLASAARALERREEQRVAEVAAARDRLSERAAEIEGELDRARARLSSAELAQASGAEEVRSLAEERALLLGRLAELERRETAMRQAGGAQVEALQAEQRALEDLLDEALADVRAKEDELRLLQRQVKKQERSEASAARGADQLAKRLRTLYKNVEVEDRAVQDLIDLGDESMRLRAEESVKRLSDDPDQAQVRRKVGGLPPHLSIFELGFAGGGRIYYTRGRTRRHRVLRVGTKASQKPDLEYLSRLPRE